jgi:hypothetical protein
MLTVGCILDASVLAVAKSMEPEISSGLRTWVGGIAGSRIAICNRNYILKWFAVGIVARLFIKSPMRLAALSIAPRACRPVARVRANPEDKRFGRRWLPEWGVRRSLHENGPKKRKK